MFRMAALPLLCLLLFPIITQGSPEVVWNVASGPCLKKKPEVVIPLVTYNISHNEDQQFFGRKIVLFYEKHFGLCPYYNNSKPDQPINGGLPQKVLVSDHLVAVIKDIRTKIPDRNFDGLAVIDLEEWRPLFKMNWGKQKGGFQRDFVPHSGACYIHHGHRKEVDVNVYREQSVALVKSKHPKLSHKKALLLAEKEFNEAARIFFVWTLKMARRIRPKAHWGYYDYPFCNAHAGDTPNVYSCNKKAKQYNDELDFIYRTSTALFPSIYLNGEKTEKQAFRSVQAFIQETRRVAEKRNPPLEFFVYTKFEYDPYTNITSFYSKGDLCNTMKQPADLGANGLVLWSTSKNMKSRCELISDYVKSELGPTLVDIRQKLDECRRKRCYNRGTCVLQKPAKTCKFDVVFTDYICRCDRGYKGKDCSQVYKNYPFNITST
ncbi:EGF-like domain protein [Ostertagia ostertagi]